MTLDQLRKAFEYAKHNECMLTEDLSVFDGFGLPDFQPVVVTTAQVAALMRWQCLCLDGSWDMPAIQEVRIHGRRKFEIIE